MMLCKEDKEELNKVWLITGTGGMDGSTLCDFLLQKGYKNIHGTMRRSATFNTQNIDHIFNKLTLHYCDLTDAMNIYNIISKVKPDYIVNFAAQSHVKVSHDLENYTFQVNTLGILNILQSVRALKLTDTCKIYHASTSEMFGNETDGSSLLSEQSKRNPVSIYGISKVAAENICEMYKNAYDMFIVTSTLFNHEGERRGGIFMTQKIANYIGKYSTITQVNKLNLNSDECTIKPLQLGNLNARRDMGYAKDYVEAIYLMLMQKIPKNYVIATGETHSVREFVECAFNEIGVNVKWCGEGLYEKGINCETGEILVEVNPKYFRDIDIECLIGDASLAQKDLNWMPKTSFKELVHIMVTHAINKNLNK
jgi:GDPmannose 4,6-dehydratase